jgi:hypothetical protein
LLLAFPSGGSLNLEAEPAAITARKQAAALSLVLFMFFLDLLLEWLVLCADHALHTGFPQFSNPCFNSS